MVGICVGGNCPSGNSLSGSSERKFPRLKSHLAEFSGWELSRGVCMCVSKRVFGRGGGVRATVWS